MAEMNGGGVMDPVVLGAATALLSPLAMTIGFFLMGTHWKGSALMLNCFKNSLGSCMFLALVLLEHYIFDGKQAAAADSDAVVDTTSYTMLMLSAFVGIVIGDLAWLQALQMIGAKRVILVHSLKPFIAAILAWLILSEPASLATLCGMAVTTLGITIVSLERSKGGSEQDDGGEGGEKAADAEEQGGQATGESVGEAEKGSEKGDGEDARVKTGFIYAFFDMILDVLGAIITKNHGGGLSPWAIQLVRFGSAAVVLVAGSLLIRWAYMYSPRSAWIPMDNAGEGGKLKTGKPPDWVLLPSCTKRDWQLVCLAVSLTTVTASILTVHALFRLEVGVCLTLTSIGPLYALVVAWIMHSEKPTQRAFAGTLLACAGVWMFALQS